MLSKIESIKQNFRRINKKVEVIASNNDQETRMEKQYLPGRTISNLMERLARIKVQDKDKNIWFSHLSSLLQDQ